MAAQDVATYAFSPDEVRSLVPGREYKLGIRLAASTAYPKGQALRLVTNSTTNTYQPVAAGDTPECILPFACATDASGNITRGAAAGTGGWPGGNTDTTVEAFFGGVIQMSDIVTSGTNGLTPTMIGAAGWHSQLAATVLSF